MISEGKKVMVKTQSGNSVSGKMVAWTPDSLSVQLNKDNTIQLSRSEVTQVVLVIGWSRGRKAGLGFLIGDGACGALVGGVAGPAGGSDLARVILGVSLFCGGPAAGIAALFPPHKEVIYTAPPPPNLATDWSYARSGAQDGRIRSKRG